MQKLAHSLPSSLFTSPSRPAGGVFRLQLVLPVQLRGVRLRLLRVPLQRGRVAGGRPTPAATRPVRPVSVRRRDQQPVSVLPVVSTAADCWFCRLSGCRFHDYSSKMCNFAMSGYKQTTFLFFCFFPTEHWLFYL